MPKKPKFVCDGCGSYRDPNSVHCSTCDLMTIEREMSQILRALSDLPLEDRIARIEKILYNLGHREVWV